MIKKKQHIPPINPQIVYKLTWKSKYYIGVTGNLKTRLMLHRRKWKGCTIKKLYSYKSRERAYHKEYSLIWEGIMNGDWDDSGTGIGDSKYDIMLNRYDFRLRGWIKKNQPTFYEGYFGSD
jgi:hypothetical protein